MSCMTAEGKYLDPAPALDKGMNQTSREAERHRLYAGCVSFLEGGGSYVEPTADLRIHWSNQTSPDKKKGGGAVKLILSGSHLKPHSTLTPPPPPKLRWSSPQRFPKLPIQQHGLSVETSPPTPKRP